MAAGARCRRRAPRRPRSRRAARRASASAAAAAAAAAAVVTEEGLAADAVSYAPAGVAATVLDGTSVSLPATGLHLLVGASGAGKTSLLMVLAGLAPETAGVVRVGGVPATAEERAASVGLVFQFPERHFLARTVLEELTYGWPRGGAAAAQQRAALAGRLEGALRAVGLGTLQLDAPVRTLSGGYQRRLALALQLVRNPRALLLDEPLAGLDWQTRASVVKLLAGLKRDVCILVVTHDTRELVPVADSAWRMAPGGVITAAPDLLTAR